MMTRLLPFVAWNYSRHPRITSRQPGCDGAGGVLRPRPPGASPPGQPRQPGGGQRKEESAALGALLLPAVLAPQAAAAAGARAALAQPRVVGRLGSRRVEAADRRPAPGAHRQPGRTDGRVRVDAG